MSGKIWFILNIIELSSLTVLLKLSFNEAIINHDQDLNELYKMVINKFNASNLNEELGMVNFMFSDKTGTLTQNVMKFKNLFTGG